eukprot:258160-Prymnesium_polylepis.1
MASSSTSSRRAWAACPSTPPARRSPSHPTCTSATFEDVAVPLAANAQARAQERQRARVYSVSGAATRGETPDVAS